MTEAMGENMEAAVQRAIGLTKRRVAIIDRAVPHYREALYDRLMRQGRHDYHIFAAVNPTEKMNTVEFPRENWRWTDAPSRRIPGTGGRSMWQWAGVRLGLSRRFDTILMMANPSDPHLWACAILGRMTGKRILMWTHGPKYAQLTMRNRIQRLWQSLASQCLFYGHHGKVQTLRWNTPPHTCHVIYNSLDYPKQAAIRDGLPTDTRERVRRELFEDAASPLVICISRLYRRKRVDLLLEAMCDLRERGTPVNALIVGDGEDRPSLERLARELELEDRACFYGPCYDEVRTAELLTAADVCVAPHAVGLTAMHALAYGAPVITCDDPALLNPEFEAIIPGRTGDFFTPDDPHELARAIGNWIGRVEERPAIMSNCIEIIERFYHPDVQAALIERAVDGDPANDLAAAWGELRRFP